MRHSPRLFLPLRYGPIDLFSQLAAIPRLGPKIGDVRDQPIDGRAPAPLRNVLIRDEAADAEALRPDGDFLPAKLRGHDSLHHVINGDLAEAGAVGITLGSHDMTAHQGSAASGVAGPRIGSQERSGPGGRMRELLSPLTSTPGTGLPAIHKGPLL